MFNNNIFFIAEAGINHNGSLQLARKLIEKAKLAGCNAIKFQSFITEKLIIKKNKKKFNFLKKHELSFKKQSNLINYCKTKKIIFISSPFDIESFNFLKKKKIKIIKIPSGEITNYLLLKEIAKYNKKTILSTGMSKIYEIKNAVNFLIKHGLSKKNLCILHCTSLYPTKLNDLNLNYILFLKKKFNCEIGFSDHTKDFLAPIMASSLGVNIIEKHITLSNKMKGPDHISSMEVKQLPKLIKVLKDSKIALNGSKKETLIKEEITKKMARKSIFAISKIKSGDFFSKKNIAILRPNTGIEPKNYFNLIGKRSKKNYFLYEPIKK